MRWGLGGRAETSLSALILMVIYCNLNSNTDSLLTCLHLLVTRGTFVQFMPETTKCTRICNGHEITKGILDVFI